MPHIVRSPQLHQAIVVFHTVIRAAISSSGTQVFNQHSASRSIIPMLKFQAAQNLRCMQAAHATAVVAATEIMRFAAEPSLDTLAHVTHSMGGLCFAVANAARALQPSQRKSAVQKAAVIIEHTIRELGLEGLEASRICVGSLQRSKC